MISLSNYFSKFKGIDKGNNDKVLELIKIIDSVCGFTLDTSEVVIDREVVKLKTSPLKRNEIFMHKEEILSKLVDLNLGVKDIK